MDYEEKLLKINEKYSPPNDDITFGDYVTLQRCLDEIGKITNYYFNLYENSKIEINDKWNEWLDNSMVSEVNIEKYIIDCSKYLIDNYPC